MGVVANLGSSADVRVALRVRSEPADDGPGLGVARREGEEAEAKTAAEDDVGTVSVEREVVRYGRREHRLEWHVAGPQAQEAQRGRDGVLPTILREAGVEAVEGFAVVSGGAVGEDEDLAAVEKALADSAVPTDVIERLSPVTGSCQGTGAIGEEHGPEESFGRIGRQARGHAGELADGLVRRGGATCW
ncbi:hypothetical protein [Pseudofrankia inefficax]|uniref:hypothetical protein n=1 Tax=Pseudofrankia inefficax (strain DSM 45817 / CECT 9037 / DDB 130130 / EuI1c) TaxID=298654 RepID=UPI00059D4867|nr:hypothetical protein [Pseudofrankia inefficax]